MGKFTKKVNNELSDEEISLESFGKTDKKKKGETKKVIKRAPAKKGKFSQEMSETTKIKLKMEQDRRDMLRERARKKLEMKKKVV